jgi:adenine-specific DNA-methyltransferase
MDETYRSQQLITCIGNKRKLINFIEEAVVDVKKRLGVEKPSFFDGFSGSGVVARMLKTHASLLVVNDLEDYSRVCNEGFLLDPFPIESVEVRHDIQWLNKNALEEQPRGFIEELYAPADDNDIKPGERVFYTNENAKIIDNIRRMINSLPTRSYYCCLAALLVKASIHCNTSGVFKGFHKHNGVGHFGGKGENALKRIKGRIVLEPPTFSSTPCKVEILQGDVNEAAELVEVDVAYYDPPYNQHPYGSNYFMLNLIASYKRPDVGGVSGIPTDWNRSAYNRSTAADALDDLVSKTKAKFVLLSYNNEGLVPEAQLRSILERYGSVEVRSKLYETYRGSRNLRNRSLKVEELLWVLKKS